MRKKRERERIAKKGNCDFQDVEAANLKHPDTER
jgi:hypothetical protein